MFSKNILVELSEIKNRFLEDKDVNKAFRSCLVLILSRERERIKLKKKVEKMEDELKLLREEVDKLKGK